MSSSRSDLRPGEAARSSEISGKNTSSSSDDRVVTENGSAAFSVTQQTFAFEPDTPASGSLDDASIVRGVLIESLRKCQRSRAEIAEKMSYLLARPVTEQMLNAFTAESRGDRRWPAEFDRAFCKATGDDTLLKARAELAGLHVITDSELDLLELGKQYLLRRQADELIALLEKRLHGRAL